MGCLPAYTPQGPTHMRAGMLMETSGDIYPAGRVFWFVNPATPTRNRGKERGLYRFWTIVRFAEITKQRLRHASPFRAANDDRGHWRHRGVSRVPIALRVPHRDNQTTTGTFANRMRRKFRWQSRSERKGPHRPENCDIQSDSPCYRNEGNLVPAVQGARQERRYHT